MKGREERREGKSRMFLNSLNEAAMFYNKAALQMAQRLELGKPSLVKINEVVLTIKCARDEQIDMQMRLGQIREKKRGHESKKIAFYSNK